MKLVVNILDNELCSSKARINFNRNKIGHVLKLVFLNIIQWTCRFIHDFRMLYIDDYYNLLFNELLRCSKTFLCSKTCPKYSDYVTKN